ncbi:MAG TPA: hypothetical protein VGR11_11730 [Solirubrobacteraceae bacterium]|nr:hypothetical protein [Solirubrobacteraceae bacterium]
MKRSADDPDGPPWRLLGPLALLALVPAIYATGQTEPASWVTLTGVLAVALLTWLATDRRQQIALREEAKRQKPALAHDRELAERADFREFLDAAASAYQRARESIISLGTYGRGPAPFDEHEYARRRADAQDCAVAVYDTLVRLRLRLPAEDPVWQSFVGIRDCVHTALKPFPAVADAVDLPPINAHRFPLERAAEHFREFAAAVRERLAPPMKEPTT